MCKRSEQQKKQQRFFLRTVFWTILGALAFALTLPLFLKLINWINFFDWTIFYITEDISEWFAFYGSLAGVVVSIILTVITFRLTLEIEKNNQNNADLQNRSAVMMNIPYMYCKEIKLYSENDFIDDYIDIKSYKQDYTLYLKMDSGVPTYFDVIVESIVIFVPHQKEDKIDEKTVVIEKGTYSIYNNNKFCLYINMPSDANNILKKLYYMDLIAPIDSPVCNYMCTIKMNLNLKNALRSERDECTSKPILLSLEYNVRNKGRKGRNNYSYKKLEVVRTLMKCTK